MIRNLKIWHKFALLTLLFGIPLAALLYLLVTEKNLALDFARRERDGATYLAPLHRMLALLPEYEQKTATGEEVKATARQIDNALQTLTELQPQVGRDLQTADKLTALKAQWQKLTLLDPYADSAIRKMALSEVSRATSDLIIHVGNTSNLILDPDLDSYYMMDLVLLKLPEQQLLTAQLWDLTAVAAARQTLPPDERVRLLLLVGQLQASVNAADKSLQTAYANNPTGSLQPLSQNSRPYLETMQTFLKMLDAKLAKAERPALSVADLKAAPDALNATARFTEISRLALDELLQRRIEGFNRKKYTTLAAVGSVLLLALLLMWLVIRSLTRPMQQAVRMAESLSLGQLPDLAARPSRDETGQLLTAMNQMTAYLKDMARAADQLATGDLSANVAPLSRDDAFGNAFLALTRYLDRMAQVSDDIANGNLAVSVQPLSEKDRFGLAFRNMLERTLVLVQSQTERDEIQNSIMKLLGEVSDVATGDLTVQAEVTADMTGAIADAFNMMLTELRQLIYRVKDTTGAVNRSANYIQTATGELANSSEFQAHQIAQTTTAVQTMAVSIQEVSARAVTAARVTQNALERAQEGTQAVQNNIAAMTRVRDQVQETAKRIKRLGERSQEIGKSIQLIKDIANRTSMLALNASIQAGMAGAGGRGFLVVAEEIESLAERSSQVAKQISTLAQAVQTETKDALSAMETTSHEVISGAVRADEAGAALNAIEGVAQELAILSQAISQASQQQAVSSDAVARAMTEISQVTQRVAQGSQQTTSVVRQLAEQTEDLRTSVIAFRLPERDADGLPEMPAYLAAMPPAPPSHYVSG